MTAFRLMFLIILLILGVTSTSHARQFRFITPIASPSAPTANVPDGVIPLEQPQPIEREIVDKLIKDVISKWNTPAMADTLSKEFYDASRLNDAMATIVPRDATVRVQSVQGIQTLQQYIVPDPDGGRGDLVSIVSATVRTQVEFSSPTGGFTTLPGINEFILKVTTDAPP